MTHKELCDINLNCVVPENINTPSDGGSRKFQGVEWCERGKFPKGRGVHKELFFPRGFEIGSNETLTNFSN